MTVGFFRKQEEGGEILFCFSVSCSTPVILSYRFPQLSYAVHKKLFIPPSNSFATRSPTGQNARY